MGLILKGLIITGTNKILILVVLRQTQLLLNLILMKQLLLMVPFQLMLIGNHIIIMAVVYFGQSLILLLLLMRSRDLLGMFTGYGLMTGIKYLQFPRILKIQQTLPMVVQMIMYLEHFGKLMLYSQLCNSERLGKGMKCPLIVSTD